LGNVAISEGGKLENLEKNPWSKARTNNKFSPHMTAGACFLKVPKSFCTWKAVAKY